MQTNFEIDEKLIQSAQRAAKTKTPQETIERGLKALIILSQQERLRQLRGKISWRGDLDTMRTSDAAT